MAERTYDQEIALLTDKVRELFKENYKRGTLPNQAQCYSLATLIRMIQANKSYKANFAGRNLVLRKRRALIQAMKRCIAQQRSELSERLGSGARLPGWQDDKHLEALAAALDKATPALLPSDPLAGERDKGWWHKAARMIDERAETALMQAGHKKISRHKHGAFVHVVTGALKLAICMDFKPETVAAVLNDQLSQPKLAG